MWLCGVLGRSPSLFPLFLFLFPCLSFVDWVKAVLTQPLSFVRRGVIQMDVKELLEMLKTFVYFCALRCEFRLGGIWAIGLGE